VRTVVGRVDHDGVVGDPEIVQLLQDLPDRGVVLDHAVGIFGAGRETGRAAMFFAHVRTEMHARGVEPAEERLAGLHLAIHELHRRCRRLVVDHLQAFLGERAGAEELVEAVVGRQELVLVPQMVLADLAGGVAKRLERLGDGDVAGLQAGLGGRGADLAVAVRSVHRPVIKVDRPAVQLCSAS
jgi:hypothetical protein